MKSPIGLDIGAHASGAIDSLVTTAIATLLAVRLRNQLTQIVGAFWHSLVACTTHKHYILFWNDADLQYSYKLIDALRPTFPTHRLRAVQTPAELLNYYLHPATVSALVLIDADICRFTADPTVARRIERVLMGFLMRGGGIVGTHGVIYSHVRTKQLQIAFGGSLDDFERTPDPIRYLKTSAGREHPLSKDLPESFELEDGEVIWGYWEKDCTVHYEAVYENETIPVVVSRKHLNGRLVWTQSGSKGHTLARGIADPQEGFVRLITHALSWVSKENRVLRQAEACRIVAHRGASFLRHENTVEAFELAIAFGADYIELDVRRTGDGVIIVHHDPDVNGKPIASNTLEVLRSSARDCGYTLAGFEEVLRLSHGRIKLNVELKEEGYEEEVLKSVRSVLGDREFVITSFSDVLLQRIKGKCRDVRCGLLLGRANPRKRFITRWSELFPVRRALNVDADFVAPHYSLLRFGFSTRLRAYGIPLWVWTVDDAALIDGLLSDLSVEAVITNVPDVALTSRKRMVNEGV